VDVGGAEDEVDVLGKEGVPVLEVVGASVAASKDERNSSQFSGAREDIGIKKPAEDKQ
jgi:hypothetical protein